VFFVVNFLTGMLAQKCHDPDCSHFRYAMPDLDKHRMLGLYLAEKPVWPSSHLNPDHPGTPKARNPQARAGVAQLVERKALNLVVKGSSPFFGDRTFYFELFFGNAQRPKFVGATG
jgi:hypothetical protein